MSDFKQEKGSQNKADSRRRFLRKAGVTSLVLGLPSQSVWGTTCTVSGNLSGNVSDNHSHDNCTITGKSPGYWHKLSRWPAEIQGFVWSDVFFNAPFGTHADTGVAIPASTPLIDFMPQDGSDSPVRGTQNLNMHLVAAYLNAYTGKYPLAPGVTAAAYVNDLYDEIDLVGPSSIAAADIKKAIEDTYEN